MIIMPCKNKQPVCLGRQAVGYMACLVGRGVACWPAPTSLYTQVYMCRCCLLAVRLRQMIAQALKKVPVVPVLLCGHVAPA
jgi:hypothetical protein